jgi:hypothetical protein
MSCSPSNTCDIKYLLLQLPTPGLLHNIAEYEYAIAPGVRHSSFEELRAAVRSYCPHGYRCLEPIAMLHELVWCMRRDEEDRLLRPIYQEEYPHVDWRHTRSVCVHVARLPVH